MKNPLAYRTRVLEESKTAQSEALTLLRAGEVIGFATDTVYGVGADGLNPEAIEALYIVKDRPENKAIPLLVAESTQAVGLAREWPDAAECLARRFWPGGLTLVVRAVESLPQVLLGQNGTVALRLPDHTWLRGLIRELGRPLAATSANLSGRAEALTALEVLAQLDGRFPLLINGGRARGGRASTVVDVTTRPPRVLREGAIPVASLAEALGYTPAV